MPDLFDADGLLFIHLTVKHLERATYSAEQLEALQVTFFGLPELPDHLKTHEALLAWQMRLGDVRARMAERGYGAEVDAVLSRHAWQRTPGACRAAYEELKAEALRVSSSAATVGQLEDVAALLEVAGCVTEHEKAALLAYMLDCPKPVPAARLSPARLSDFCHDWAELDADERASCLQEARRRFNVLAP